MSQPQPVDASVLGSVAAESLPSDPLFPDLPASEFSNFQSSSGSTFNPGTTIQFNLPAGVTMMKHGCTQLSLQGYLNVSADLQAICTRAFDYASLSTRAGERLSVSETSELQLFIPPVPINGHRVYGMLSLFSSITCEVDGAQLFRFTPFDFYRIMYHLRGTLSPIEFANLQRRLGCRLAHDSELLQGADALTDPLPLTSDPEAVQIEINQITENQGAATNGQVVTGFVIDYTVHYRIRIVLPLNILFSQFFPGTSWLPPGLVDRYILFTLQFDPVLYGEPRFSEFEVTSDDGVQVATVNDMRSPLITEGGIITSAYTVPNIARLGAWDVWDISGGSTPVTSATLPSTTNNTTTPIMDPSPPVIVPRVYHKYDRNTADPKATSQDLIMKDDVDSFLVVPVRVIKLPVTMEQLFGCVGASTTAMPETYVSPMTRVAKIFTLYSSAVKNSGAILEQQQLLLSQSHRNFMYTGQSAVLMQLSALSPNKQGRPLTRHDGFDEMRNVIDASGNYATNISANTYDAIATFGRTALRSVNSARLQVVPCGYVPHVVLSRTIAGARKFDTTAFAFDYSPTELDAIEKLGPKMVFSCAHESRATWTQNLPPIFNFIAPSANAPIRDAVYMQVSSATGSLTANIGQPSTAVFNVPYIVRMSTLAGECTAYSPAHWSYGYSNITTTSSGTLYTSSMLEARPSTLDTRPTACLMVDAPAYTAMCATIIPPHSDAIAVPAGTMDNAIAVTPAAQTNMYVGFHYSPAALFENGVAISCDQQNVTAGITGYQGWDARALATMRRNGCLYNGRMGLFELADITSSKKADVQYINGSPGGGIMGIVAVADQGSDFPVGGECNGIQSLAALGTFRAILPITRGGYDVYDKSRCASASRLNCKPFFEPTLGSATPSITHYITATLQSKISNVSIGDVDQPVNGAYVNSTYPYIGSYHATGIHIHPSVPTVSVNGDLGNGTTMQIELTNFALYIRSQPANSSQRSLKPAIDSSEGLTIPYAMWVQSLDTLVQRTADQWKQVCDSITPYDNKQMSKQLTAAMGLIGMFIGVVATNAPRPWPVYEVTLPIQNCQISCNSTNMYELTDLPIPRFPQPTGITTLSNDELDTLYGAKTGALSRLARYTQQPNVQWTMPREKTFDPFNRKIRETFYENLFGGRGANAILPYRTMALDTFSPNLLPIGIVNGVVPLVNATMQYNLRIWTGIPSNTIYPRDVHTGYAVDMNGPFVGSSGSGSTEYPYFAPDPSNFSLNTDAGVKYPRYTSLPSKYNNIPMVTATIRSYDYTRTIQSIDPVSTIQNLCSPTVMDAADQSPTPPSAAAYGFPNLEAVSVPGIWRLAQWHNLPYLSQTSTNTAFDAHYRKQWVNAYRNPLLMPHPPPNMAYSSRFTVGNMANFEGLTWIAAAQPLEGAAPTLCNSVQYMPGTPNPTQVQTKAQMELIERPAGILLDESHHSPTGVVPFYTYGMDATQVAVMIINVQSATIHLHREGGVLTVANSM